MLKEFLVKAKIATYASDGEGGERKLEDGGRELSFSQGAYKYRDRYYGFNPFIGEEVVWLDGRVVWGMNYCGMLVNGVDAKAVYGFLKKALKKVPVSVPYRGPELLEENGYRYENSWKEKNGFFGGSEIILSNGELVYELFYHGFVIRSK